MLFNSLDVPEPLANAIMSLYASPTFQVHDSGFTSDVHQQLGGVRQGCPLSPYLFVLCMSALFRHVELFYESHFSQIAGVINRPFPLWDLQYADDTVLLAHSPIALTRLLHTLQILALDIGLELNFSKCEHIALHSCERIRFCPDLNSEQCPCNLCFSSTEPSKLVTLVTSARYLGAYVNDTGSSAEHIKNRLSKATAAAKLLGTFFRNQCISPSFRLLVYQSVVQSILLFTIENIVPTRAELVRLDSVHFRILRQIFGIKSSFFHRVLQDDFEPCSNEYLQQLANSQGRYIYIPSQLASTRRLQLLGHILRHQDSLEYHCCFTASHSYRTAQSDFAIRRGRPRPHWAELTSLKHFVGPLLLLPLPLLIFLPISFNTHLQLKFPRLMVVPSLLGQITLLSTEQSMSEPTTDPNGELSLANFLLPEKITPGQLVYNLYIYIYIFIFFKSVYCFI